MTWHQPGPGRKPEYALTSMRVGDSFIVRDRTLNAMLTLCGYWNRKMLGARWRARRALGCRVRVERIR